MKYIQTFEQLNKKYTLSDIEEISKKDYTELSVIDKNAPDVYLKTYNEYCLSKKGFKPEISIKAKKLANKAVYDKFVK
jgi:hypothetical protein